MPFIQSLRIILRQRSALFAAGVLLLPVIELQSLRQLLRHTFGPNNAVIGFHFTDTYLPGLLGALVALEYLYREEPISTGIQLKWVAINLTLFTALAHIIVFYDSVPSLIPGDRLVALFIGMMACVSSAFFILVPFGALANRLRGDLARLWWLIAAMAVLATHAQLIEIGWPYILWPLTRALQITSNVLNLGTIQSDTPWNILFRHPLLNVSIGMPCAGMLAIVFFVFSFFLYLFLAKDRPNFPRALLYFAAGLAMMFLCNLLRIFSIIGVGILINRYYPIHYGRPFVSWAFHEHIGWLIYLGALFFFFRNLAASCAAQNRGSLRWRRIPRPHAKIH